MILLNEQVIYNRLTDTAKKLITSIRVEQSVTSTNDILLFESKINPTNNSVLLAESQTDGRGRLGKHWISPSHCNIYLSLSWHFKKSINALSGLSLCVGIAIIHALKNLGLSEKIEIKWPNDLLHDNKKLGGILIESTSITKKSAIIIIGIGLNINLLPDNKNEITQPWTSLKQITQHDHDRNKITAAMLNVLSDTLTRFEKNGLSDFMPEWKSHDYLFEKKCVVVKNGAEIIGVASGINASGWLLLKTDHSDIEAFSAGDVSIKKIT